METHTIFIIIIVMCDPTKNTMKVPYVNISVHYTCYLSCIRAWWWTDSIQYTWPKPTNENISCVLTDIHSSFLCYNCDCSENATETNCFKIMVMSG